MSADNTTTAGQGLPEDNTYREIAIFRMLEALVEAEKMLSAVLIELNTRTGTVRQMPALNQVRSAISMADKAGIKCD